MCLLCICLWYDLGGILLEGSIVGWGSLLCPEGVGDEVDEAVAHQGAHRQAHQHLREGGLLLALQMLGRVNIYRVYILVLMAGFGF